MFFIKSQALAIGDSITEAPNNYVDNLEHRSSYDFTKAGYSGKSSTFIKNQLLKMDVKKYDLIIIEAGINNLDNADVVIRDFKEMAAYIKKNTSTTRVMFLTITPYKGYSTWTLEKQIVLEKINRWMLKNPENVDCVINVYKALEIKGRLKFSADKLHPTKKGHEIMALEIMKSL